MSKSLTTRVHQVRRLNLSVNGNPRFVLTTDDGELQTSTDSACSYDVENVTHRLPVKVDLRLTNSNRIYSIERHTP